MNSIDEISLEEMRRYLDSVLCADINSDTSNAQESAPLVLLGSGSVYAQPFIAFALRNLKVVAVIDNMRIGHTLGNFQVSGDEHIVKVLKVYPNAIGVIC